MHADPPPAQNLRSRPVPLPRSCITRSKRSESNSPINQLLTRTICPRACSEKEARQREGWAKRKRAWEVVQFVSADNVTGHFGECITGIQWKGHGLLRWGAYFTFSLFTYSISSPSRRRRQPRETEGWR